MKTKRLITLPLTVLMLAALGCGSNDNISSSSSIPSGPKLNGVYHNENNVGYQLLVYSFNDSDGDGRGDIKGITQKLDYFVDLGVNVLWLSPINKAGSYHGYDVQDYYSINSRLGSEADLKELIEEAHKKDIKILLDMVVNHTSNSHPWFIDARRNPESKYRNYYIQKQAGVTYGTSTNSSAAWHMQGDFNYYSSFTSSMPDLNLGNPEVMAEVKNIFNYWVDFGVDGFRLDAIKHFFDPAEYATGTNVKEMTANCFNEINLAMKEKNPNIFFVGEWLDEGGFTSYKTSAPYIDSQFSFYSRKMLIDTASGSKSAMGLATKITTEINELTALNPDFTYTPIISNHDHDRIASTYGFFDSKLKLRLINSMLLTLPGMPFVYSGDELGMTGDRYNNDDIERRLPFKWGEGNEVNPDTYGRGKYDPSELTKRTSVIEAKADVLSLYNLHKDILAVRKATKAYAGGKMSVFGDDSNSDVMAFFIEANGQKLLIAHNVKNRAKELNLNGVKIEKNLFTSYNVDQWGKDFEKDSEGNYTLSKANTYTISGDVMTLAPFSTVIFEVK